VKYQDSVKYQSKYEPSPQSLEFSTPPEITRQACEPNSPVSVSRSQVLFPDVKVSEPSHQSFEFSLHFPNQASPEHQQTPQQRLTSSFTQLQTPLETPPTVRGNRKRSRDEPSEVPTLTKVAKPTVESVDFGANLASVNSGVQNPLCCSDRRCRKALSPGQGAFFQGELFCKFPNAPTANKKATSSCWQRAKWRASQDKRQKYLKGNEQDNLGLKRQLQEQEQVIRFYKNENQTLRAELQALKQQLGLNGQSNPNHFQ
jgi:hypothetical protein